MYECDKNQMPYYNVKSFFGEFWAIDIEHGSHWINFTILTFISEKDRYFRCLYKIWNKIISFDMRKNDEM